MKKYKHFWRYVLNLLKKKDVFFNASAITFNLLICAIPFTLLLISIIGFILSYDAAFREIIRYGRELFPHFSYTTDSGDVIRGAITIETLLRPLIQQRRVFGIVGVVVLIFFSQGLFATIKHVIFTVFSIKDRSHYLLEMVYNFFAFGLVGGVFIFFSIVISFISLISLDQISLPVLNLVIGLRWILDVANIVIPILFTFFLFYTILRYLSEKRLSPKVSFAGALFYTIFFEIAKFGIGLYLNHAIRAYKYFYQGYALLVVIGIWAFYSAVLLVVSAIIARAYQEVYLKQSLPIQENPYDEIS